MSLYHSPQISLNGLVLCLDAANRKSYPTTGTTWTDLSGLGNTGALQNGVGYNVSNGGSLSFDGTNLYATIPHSSSLSFSSALTISIWFYSGTVSAQAFLYLKGRTDSDNYNPLIYNTGQYSWTGANGRAQYQSSAGYIANNTWYNLTVSHTSGSVPNIYKNGILSTSHTFLEGNATYALGTNLNPIGINADIPRLLFTTFNGRISSLQAYNRALSASEIKQNYNALKSRYGLT